MALTLPTAAFAANEQTEPDISKGNIVINDDGALIRPRTGEGMQLPPLSPTFVQLFVRTPGETLAEHWSAQNNEWSII